MTYKKFEELMLELIQLKKDCDAVNKAFKVFDPDFGYISFSRWETLYMNTIKESMNDKYDWISYWVYDKDCGKDTKLGCIKDKNGKSIPIKTLKNLYNLIVSDSI